MARPTKHRKEFDNKAYKLCLLGATDKQLGDFFEVDESTINNWKLEYPEFLESIKKGKEEADATVAEKLYHRATGYSHEAVKIVADAKSGTQHIVPYTEHYPPDTAAAIFWLKNRRKSDWRDKAEVENTGEQKIIIETRKHADDNN